MKKKKSLDAIKDWIEAYKQCNIALLKENEELKRIIKEGSESCCTWYKSVLLDELEELRATASMRMGRRKGPETRRKTLHGDYTIGRRKANYIDRRVNNGL